MKVRDKIFVLFVFCMLTFTFLCRAQEDELYKNKLKIGISFSSFGYKDVHQFMLEDGDPRYSGRNFYTLNINYLYTINSNLEIFTGIVYGHYKIKITPFSPHDPIYYKDISLIYIPLMIQKNFLKYCYINGGLLIDIDLRTENSFDNQSGVGGSFGLGIKYDFLSKLSAFINPYITIHSIIPFSFNVFNDRLLESGLRFGLMYKI